MSTTIAPYGTWKSPITADLITAKAVSFSDLRVHGGDIYWSEARPLEGGRCVVMRRAADGTISERTPAGFSARTRVHEYGGGAFAVGGGSVVFCNFADQRLYRESAGAAPALLTPGDGYRYADLIADEKRGRVICIREDHTGPGEAVNTIASVGLAGGDHGTILVSGKDFYASACLSPAGDRLAWLAWSHPNMPWDGTELWVADVLADGTLRNGERAAGSASESIFQPSWAPDGVLHFVAEHTGWWNLYRWQDGRVEALCPMEAEFGLPQWVFAMSTYGFASANRIVCAWTRDGLWSLGFLEIRSRKLTRVELPFSDINGLRVGAVFAVFFAGSPTQPDSIVRLDLESLEPEVVTQSFQETVGARYLSAATPKAFPTTGGKTAHTIYYAPHNEEFVAPPGERPPLMVICHGGPTGATGTTLRYGIQYWTSRGFAVLDVNYGGSTGYGRDYRRRLIGSWGVVDLDDCCSAALDLVAQGLADPRRLAIRGGSAGGYTTLACLAFRDVFKAGASHFGVSDLEALAKDTHKFESRYLDSIVGPYPECKDRYHERSPVNFAGNISCPIILFQGDEDRIVPPSQSELMFNAVRAKGIPTAYLLFQGEQHGFRKADSIRRALEAELYFYGQVFGFTPADRIEPVRIENM